MSIYSVETMLSTMVSEDPAAPNSMLSGLQNMTCNFSAHDASVPSVPRQTKYRVRIKNAKDLELLSSALCQGGTAWLDKQKVRIVGVVQPSSSGNSSAGNTNNVSNGTTSSIASIPQTTGTNSSLSWIHTLSSVSSSPASVDSTLLSNPMLPLSVDSEKTRTLLRTSDVTITSTPTTPAAMIPQHQSGGCVNGVETDPLSFLSAVNVVGSSNGFGVSIQNGEQRVGSMNDLELLSLIACEAHGTGSVACGTGSIDVVKPKSHFTGEISTPVLPATCITAGQSCIRTVNLEQLTRSVVDTNGVSLSRDSDSLCTTSFTHLVPRTCWPVGELSSDASGLNNYRMHSSGLKTFAAGDTVSSSGGPLRTTFRVRVNNPKELEMLSTLAGNGGTGWIGGQKVRFVGVASSIETNSSTVAVNATANRASFSSSSTSLPRNIDFPTGDARGTGVMSAPTTVISVVRSRCSVSAGLENAVGTDSSRGPCTPSGNVFTSAPAPANVHFVNGLRHPMVQAATIPHRPGSVFGMIPPGARYLGTMAAIPAKTVAEIKALIASTVTVGDGEKNSASEATQVDATSNATVLNSTASASLSAASLPPEIVNSLQKLLAENRQRMLASGSTAALKFQTQSPVVSMSSSTSSQPETDQPVRFDPWGSRGCRIPPPACQNTAESSSPSVVFPSPKRLMKRRQCLSHVANRPCKKPKLSDESLHPVCDNITNNLMTNATEKGCKLNGFFSKARRQLIAKQKWLMSGNIFRKELLGFVPKGLLELNNNMCSQDIDAAVVNAGGDPQSQLQLEWKMKDVLTNSSSKDHFDLKTFIEYFQNQIRDSQMCARVRPFQHPLKKKRDMFSFLTSWHRTKPELDADNVPPVEQLHSKRPPLCLDGSTSLRFGLLRGTWHKTLGIYRSSIHGLGLFCRRDIDAGDMVVEYAGEVIRSSVADLRERRYESRGIGCYMFRRSEDEIVDATMCGNVSRFINHSCEPNCYSRQITIGRRRHIIIFALRNIHRGEELTYDYKFPREDVKMPCFCTARRCRKYLN